MDIEFIAMLILIRRLLKIIVKKPMQEEDKVKVVYFSTRGQAQVIRMLLMAIGAPYQDVNVCQKTGIPADIRDQYGLEIQKLPYLIHGRNVVYQLFPILKYCCERFNRADLLGVNINDGARVAEIVVKYLYEKNRGMEVFMRGVKAITEKGQISEEDIEQVRDRIYQVSRQNKFLQIAVELFRKSHGFLMGYPTILDFMFYEVCFKILHLGNVQNRNQSPVFLYVNFFQSTNFFKIHAEKINSYKIFFVHQINPELAPILAKIWRELPEIDGNQ